MTYSKPNAIVASAAEAIQSQQLKMHPIVSDSNLNDPTKQTSTAYEADE